MNWAKKQIKRFTLLLALEQEGKVKIGYTADVNKVKKFILDHALFI